MRGDGACPRETSAKRNDPLHFDRGGRALLKMVEYTADRMLERIASQFPVAITRAAKAYEATFA